MALPGKDWRPGPHRNSPATRLISVDLTPVDIPPLAQKVDLKTGENSSGRLQVITAYYDLAQADNRTTIEWLLRCAPISAKPRSS
jgi:hypothetical protein